MPPLGWLADGGWQTACGTVVLERLLQDALARLNPDLPPEALADAFRKVTRPEGLRAKRATVPSH